MRTIRRIFPTDVSHVCLYGDLNPYYSIGNLGFNFGHVKSGADNGTQPIYYSFATLYTTEMNY